MSSFYSEEELSSLGLKSYSPDKFFKRFVDEEKHNKQRVTEVCSLFVASILIAIASVIILIWARQHGFPYGPYAFVSDSNAPLAVLVSVCAFMFFKNVKIKQSNFVNILGGGYFWSPTYPRPFRHHAPLALARCVRQCRSLRLRLYDTSCSLSSHNCLLCLFLD